jgi:hypothetical protein
MELMGPITALTLGLIFITIGCVIRFGKMYFLISGYNTLPPSERKLVDIEGYARFLGLYTLVLGAWIIVSYFVFHRLNFPVIAFIVIISSTLFALPVLLLKGRKFFPTQIANKNHYMGIGITIVIFLFLLVSGMMMFKDSRPIELIKIKNEIAIKSTFGTTFDLDKVANIELIQTLPEIKSKIKGFDFDKILRGEFLLETWGKGKLYITSDCPPYLKIDLKDNQFIVVNWKEKDKTRKVFSNLTSLVSK